MELGLGCTVKKAEVLERIKLVNKGDHLSPFRLGGGPMLPNLATIEGERFCPKPPVPNSQELHPMGLLST